MSLFAELKRRNVFRVAAAYAVISWLVIQVANTLVPVLELSPSVTKTVFLILLLGFIPAVFFSWAFEITPEGVKKEKNVTRDESITSLTAKKLDYVTIAAAIGVMGLFVYQQMNPPQAVFPVQTGIQNTESGKLDPSTESNSAQALNSDDSEQSSNNGLLVTETNSIAVLPFADLSQDGDQEYFADGMSEEILNALVKATGLRVAGRTSSFSFKGKDDTIKEIGRALNVAHVLEGSVRKQGNKVRITAQLIKSENEFHMWSETYDGTLDNIFDLQENISRQVTDELKIILDLNTDERLANKMTSDIDAYDLFLRGRQLVEKRLNDNIPKGIQLLQEAVKLDPEFAEAWATLAEAEAVSPGYIDTDIVEVDKRAISYAQKAIELNDQLALPYAVLALINSGNGEYFGSQVDLKQALKLEPNNPIVNRWLGINYATINRADLALPFYEKAYRLEPLSTTNAFNLAAANFVLGNNEKAIRFFRISSNLRNKPIHELSFVYDLQDKTQQARANFLEAYKSDLESNTVGELATEDDINILVQAMYNGTEQVKQAAQRLTGLYLKDSDDSAYWQLMLHVAIGNVDRAYEVLEQKPNFIHNFAPDAMWFPNEGFKDFRADPRFAQLLLKQKIPQVWQEIGWPDTCQPFDGTDGSDGQFSCE